MKNKVLILSLLTVITITFASCGTKEPANNNQPSSQTSQVNEIQTQESNKSKSSPLREISPSPNNVFNLNTVKVGDEIAGMKVISVNKDGPAISFSGEATISGTYKSDYQELFGEYISLYLDQESKNKIPLYTGQKEFDIALGNEDENIRKRFGPTNTRGTFKLTIKEYNISFLPEEFVRSAEISNIIEVKKDDTGEGISLDNSESMSSVDIGQLADNNTQKESGKSNTGETKSSMTNLSDEEKAIELVKKKHNAKYNSKTNDYTIDNDESTSVVFMAKGMDERGRYVITINPSNYPLSVYSYCYVDLKTGIVEE